MAGPPPGLSRRRFLALAGAGAGAVALGACGGGDDDEADTDGSDGTSGDRELVLAPYLQGPFYFAGSEQPGHRSGWPTARASSRSRTRRRSSRSTLIDPDGDRRRSRSSLERHGDGTARAYFPLRVTLDEPGIYTIRAEPLGGGGGRDGLRGAGRHPRLHGEAGRPDARSLDTPTVADARGVDPICTADPVCALHDVTLADALAAGGPVALLVATPGVLPGRRPAGRCSTCCSTAVAAHPDVHFLHAEVYAAPAT